MRMNERMETTLTTSQFFDMLKNQKLYSLKQEVMDTLINELKTNRIKADNIGQTILSQKLDFLIDVTEKEKVLFEKGFTELPRKIRERPKIVNNFNFLVVK